MFRQLRSPKTLSGQMRRAKVWQKFYSSAANAEQAEGSNLRRVRRLSLGLLYLFVRLGGSLLDVERELHVVVVDANAIARLD